MQLVETTPTPRLVPVSPRSYVMRGDASRKALDVFHLIFAPTHACNLRCRHCYLPDHAGSLVPLAEVRRLIDQWESIVVRDRGELGGYFHLKGGEPLIVPYLPELLRILSDKATLRFMMTTNGTLLSDELRSGLGHLNERTSGEVLIIVSLDGSSEEVHSELRGPGHFEASRRFAETLISDGINVHFNYVVHSGNLEDVVDFVEFAETTGAQQVNFLPMVPRGYGAAMGDQGRPDARVLHEMLARLFINGDERRRRLLAGNYADILAAERKGVTSSNECVAGYRGLLYVTPEGDVYSCPNLVRARLRLGNFLASSLVDIHDQQIGKLYRSGLLAPALDERYLCRGERRSDAETKRTSGLRILQEDPPTDDAYPSAARALQSIILDQGLATKLPDQGMSYCFSRNF